MMLVDVCASSDLAEGQMYGVQTTGEEIALFRIDGMVYATSNICTHAYALMTEGYFDGKCIECPLHQGLFDVVTGEALEAPAKMPLKTFKAVERDKRIYVELQA